MRLLSVCICVGILICLVNSSFAKKRDENDIDTTQELEEQEAEEEEDPVPVKKQKHPKKKSPLPKKNTRDSLEDYPEDGEDTIYLNACGKGKDSICKCDDNTLNCEKVLVNGEPLTRIDVVLNDVSMVAKHVNFRNNAIKVLDEGLLPDLGSEVEVMDFSHNYISKIEAHTFDAFTELKILNLSLNLLPYVSGSCFTRHVGKSLHQLFLNDNKIKKVSPLAFENLKELTKLVLDGNVGIKVYKNMFPVELKKLETLSMDRCGIKELDDGVFENLVNLKYLSLQMNPITTIPKAINGLPNLVGLDLSGTSIVHLAENQLAADHNLTELYISNMPFLYAIYSCAFCDLPNLKKIVLANNTQLYDFNENAFGAIEHKKDSKYPVAALEEFDIHDSNFSTLPEKLFDWEKVKTLTLYGNPFNCTCDIAWLVNDKNLHLFETIPKCAEPKDLKGIMFTKLDDKVCGGNTSVSSSSSFVMWAFVLFLTVIGLLGGFLIYTRRVRVTNILYRPEVPEMGYSNLTAQQQRHPERDDEEELQDDFQPKPDAHPV